MNFEPFGHYDPARDVFERAEFVNHVRGDPPGAVCWVFVAPRRGGKTWTLKALAHHLGARARYRDVQGRAWQAPKDARDGDTLLLDEPGHTLTERDAGFVADCRALHKKGARVVVALTPAEYERLAALCVGGVGDVSRAVLRAPHFTRTEELRLAARNDDTLPLRGSLPEAWRSTPFFLTLLFHAMEQRGMDGDVEAAARAATALAEDQYDYTKLAWCEGLSRAQREVVRTCLRGRPASGPVADLLVSAGVLRRDAAGRCRVVDPILAAHLAPLRIHHVSDVHVGPKSYEATDVKSSDAAPLDAMGPRFIRDRYVEHLQQRRAEGTAPHVLVCSGDCVEYASDATQYADFAAWLARTEAELAPHPAVPSSQRTLLVGGNHDVDWNLAATGDRSRHAAFAATVGARPHPGLHHDPTHRAVAEVSFPEAGVSFALLGSAGDADLQKRVGDLRARLDGDPLVELRGVLDQLCAADADGKRRAAIEGEHWKVMRIDPGLVDDRDLARLRGHAWPHPVRIAVLHHPVSPLPDTEVARFGGLVNAGAVKEALLEKGFHLVLHGHVHRGWFVREEAWMTDGTTRTLAVAAAPTLGSRETAKDQGFNEVEVARDYDNEGRAHYRVVVRRCVRDNATWRTDGVEMGLAPIPV